MFATNSLTNRCIVICNSTFFLFVLFFSLLCFYILSALSLSFFLVLCHFNYNNSNSCKELGYQGPLNLASPQLSQSGPVELLEVGD